MSNLVSRLTESVNNAILLVFSFSDISHYGVLSVNTGDVLYSHSGDRQSHEQSQQISQFI